MNVLSKQTLCAGLSGLLLAGALTGCAPSGPAAEEKTTTTTTAPTTTTTSATTTTTTTAKPTTTTTTTTTTTKATTTTTKKPTTTTALLDALGDNASAQDAMDAIIKNAVKQYGGVGVQVAVLSGQEVVQEGAYGWAQKDEVKVTPDTMYRTGSITKTVVGMVLHRLIDDGKIALEDDISDYLGYPVRHPDHPDVPVTVKMLANHTSGLDDIDLLESLEELEKHLTGKEAFTSKPGSVYFYNNFAYSALGTVCELAADNNITDMAEEYFFKPLGIDATFYGSSIPKEKFGILYRSNGTVGLGMSEKQGKGGYFRKPGQSIFCFAGNLHVSAGDYARLLAVLVNEGEYNGQRLLSKKAVKSIQSVQFSRNGSTKQCLPVWRRDGLYGQTPLYLHTGSTYGVYSLYVYNPKNDTAVVVVTSGASGAKDQNGIYAICGYIAEAIYQNGSLFFGETTV